MNYQMVECNQCGKDFVIKQLLTRRLHAGIDELYFVCPHCQHEYVSCYTNTEIRNEQKKLQSLNERFRKAAGLKIKEQTMQRIIESKARLGTMMNELKRSVSGVDSDTSPDEQDAPL